MLRRKYGYDMPCFIFHTQNSADYLHFNLSTTTHGELELAEAKFMEVMDTHLLPSFLKSELPELRGSNFSQPTKIRLTDFE